MAETILEQIFGGMQPLEDVHKVAPATLLGSGQRISTWAFPGFPGAASAIGATLNGEALTAPVPGQIEFNNAAGGQVMYLEKFYGVATAASRHQRLILADRIWQNGGIGVTTTTAQTISAGKGKTVVWPSRDRDGSDLGVGVVVGMEVESAVTTLNNSMTLQYTNTALTTGRVGTITAPFLPATAKAGMFVPFELQGSDKGISSVQSLTLNTSLTAGTVHLVAYRILGELDSYISRGQTKGPVELGMPRLYDGTVPWLMILCDGATAACQWDAQIGYTQG